MQRHIGQLVDKIRKRTSNNGSQSNLTDDEIIDSLNEAQEALMEIILGSFGQRLFRTTYEFNLQSGVKEYDLPPDMYDDGFIEKVEFTSYPFPTERSWTRIEPIQPHESDLTSGWLIRNGKFFCDYGAGSIRLWYMGKPINVDIRRGKISAFGANYIDVSDYDITSELDTDDWLTIVDRIGTVIQSSIYKTAFNKTTGRITIDTALASTVAVDQYVVLGKKTSSHSGFSDRFERYLRTFACVDLSIFDSSGDITQESAKLAKLEEGIKDLAFMDNIDIYRPQILVY